ncbi:MAG: hypothetical protein WBD67_12170 [Terracidiphilus sp.]
MRNPNRRPIAFPFLRRPFPAHLRWTFHFFILLLALFAAAPAPAATTQSHKPHHPAHRARRVAEKKPAAPILPAAPPAPVWPVNSQPKPAAVTWDSRGLSVAASNSSLAGILQQISIATGIHVEGFSADQRVFGDYGPGPAREVLSQLLSGSGYNLLILGGTGSAPPSRIVLSPRPTGPAPPAPQSTQESDYYNGYPADAPPLPPIEPNAPGYQSSPPVRTPQQIMEEMQRQRRMQFRQQQQAPQQEPQQDQQSPDSPNR